MSEVAHEGNEMLASMQEAQRLRQQLDTRLLASLRSG